MKSDIEIARSIELKKIKQVAESIGIPREEVENYPHPGNCHYSNKSGYRQNHCIYRSRFGTQ